VEIALQGIFNVLAYANVKPQEIVSAVPEPLLIRPAHYLRAPAAGVFAAHHNLGAVIAAGDVAGTLVTPDNLHAPPRELFYPCDGMLIAWRRIARAQPGDVLLNLAENARSYLQANNLADMFRL
jgi:predicted deacylase